MARTIPKTGNASYRALAAAAALLMALVSPAAATPPGRTFWVADSFGHDTVPWDQCSPDNPFKTLDHARLEIRAYRAAGHNNPHNIVVNIAGGVYHLTQPVVFTSEDSGWANLPIQYQSWNPNRPGMNDNDDVLFSGGVELHGWKTMWAPNGVLAYVCAIDPNVKEIRDLWVNNQRMVRARFPNIQICTVGPNGYANSTTPPCPNLGFLQVKDVAAPLVNLQKVQRVTVHVVDSSGPIPVPIGDNDPTHNIWSRVEVIAHRLFVNPHQRVTSGLFNSLTEAALDFSITQVPTGQPAPNDLQDLGALGPFRWQGWQSVSPPPSAVYQFRFLEVSGENDVTLPTEEGGPRGPVTQVFLTNDLAFLDQDREWFFDPNTHELWLKLCQSPSDSGASVVAPVTQQLLMLDRTSYLRFNGLDWAYTHQPMPTQANGITLGYTTTQQGLKWLDGEQPYRYEHNNVVLPAIDLRGAFDCRLTRCRVAHTGGSALVIGTETVQATDVCIESHNDTIDNCEVFDVGGHGVYIGDDFGMRPGTWGTTPSDLWPDPSEANAVVNSKIDKFGVIYKDSVGVYLGHTRDSMVVNNEISSGNWAAMVVGDLLHAHQWKPPTNPPPPCSPNIVRPQTSEGTLIQRNNIHHNMLKLHDGGLYMQGSHIPSVRSGLLATLEGNYIHDTVLNPYLNYVTDNVVGLYFEAGCNGWVVRNNYVEHLQRPFFFNHQSKYTATGCVAEPSIFKCSDNSNIFGQSSWPVNWDENCGGYHHYFDGQSWQSGLPNYWLDAATGAYGGYAVCRGSNGMPENANIRVTSPLPSNHPIIVNAGPGDRNWFYPHVQERIHPTPVCGSADQIQ